MADKTKIGWTDASWNPVTGCTQVSPGCDLCYAKTVAESPRFARNFPNGFNVTLRPERIDQPLRWRRPRMIFVNSMSDLFHRDIPVEFLRHIWSVMVESQRHIFQVLTKRPHRAAHIIRREAFPLPPNIWLGTSVELQEFAENRIPALLEIPAAVRWLSCEPLLGAVDLRPWIGRLQWIVDGGESGTGHRPGDHGWFRDIRDTCLHAGVPYYHKQGFAHRPGQDRLLDGRLWEDYPTGFGHATKMIVQESLFR